MIKRILFLLFLLPAFSFSQGTREVDSLVNIYNSCTNDTKKIELCNQLGKLYCAIDFNKALYYNSVAIGIGKHTELPHQTADAYNIQGIIYINQGKFKDADSSLHKALTLQLKIGNRKGVASVYGNLGAMYYMASDYSRSLEYHLKCLKINEELQDKNGIALTLMNVANIYSIQKNYDESFKYCIRCRAINKELHNLKGELWAMNNLASALLNQLKADECYPYFDTIIKIAEKNEKEYTLEYALGLQGRGIYYRLKHDYRKAHADLDHAYTLYERLNNVFKEVDVWGNICSVYIQEKNFSKALEYSKAYLQKSKAIEAKQHEQDAYEFLYESYAGLKDYENAFKYHEKFMLLKDSILNNDNLKTINELETKYETKKKENENKLLVQQNQIQQLRIGRSNYFILGIAALLLFVIVIAFLFIRQNKMNAQQRTLQLEQRLLRSQMNPHFIFNSLIAIESYIYKNEPKAAGKYLSGFARLMRLILENSREEYIPLAKEMQTLDYYLQLQKNRFDETFDYTIELSGDLDPESIAIPPMLAQPFIENSIEHGLKNNDKKGTINIRFSLSNHELLFEVKDNGIGIERSMAINEQNRLHRSMATTITMERLSILNKRKRKKIRLNIDELKDEAGIVLGTRVSFVIPFKEI